MHNRWVDQGILADLLLAMSNQAVGNVYQTIIDEVVNSSRVDFEENGVDEAVLEELRQVSRAIFESHSNVSGSWETVLSYRW